MRIAVIGTGISGLSAAHLLSNTHDITVFEKNSYVGGHSNTVKVETKDGPLNVDTGFIVFNHRNYPLLRKMFQDLRVPTFKSDMSFAVSKQTDKEDFEFCSDWPKGIFADWKNAFRPSYWSFLTGITQFNQQANRDLHNELDDDQTLRDYIQTHKLNKDVVEKYIAAMVAAIWSAPYDKIFDFPINTILNFLNNHGLLSVNKHPKWHTVSQGSQTYVKRLISPFKDKIIHRPVVAISRQSAGVLVTTLKDGELTEDLFDQVIIATHADVAASLLKTKTSLEETLLNTFKYQENITYLHQDESLMPKRRSAWASWNTLLFDDNPFNQQSVCITYWMNRLQNLPQKHPLFVTLNPPKEPQRVIKKFLYHHPIFDKEAIAAQKQFASIQGIDRVWFCGSYLGYGFHEDALKSGMMVADNLGVDILWRAGKNA